MNDDIERRCGVDLEGGCRLPRTLTVPGCVLQRTVHALIERYPVRADWDDVLGDGVQ